MDIDGHPLFPTGSKQFSGNIGKLLFLADFNIRGHFEGLNEGFSWSTQLNNSQRHDLGPKMNLLDDTFPTGYHVPKAKIVCKSYDLEKLMY